MSYRYLGKSGLLVSEFTLGTMTFGAPGWGCDEKESHEIIAAYLDRGGNMIDVADVYAGGETERIIGSFMPSIARDQVILATKCNFPSAQYPLAVGSSRKHIIASVEKSLKRLKTDYIDIYYLHRSDPTVPYQEIAETFEILIQQGKVLYPALSNLPAWRVALGNQELVARQTSPFVCGQYMYNLVDRTSEQEIIPAMQYLGIGLLCWSPLAGGLLTGKYQGNRAIPQDSRFEYRKALDVPRFWNEHGLKVADKLILLSQESGISPVTLALGWLLSKQFVSSIIIGAKNIAQLEENLDVGGVDLSKEVLDALDTISDPDRSYQWVFNEEANAYFAQRGVLFPGTQIV